MSILQVFIEIVFNFFRLVYLSMAITFCRVNLYSLHYLIFKDCVRFPPIIFSFSILKNKQLPHVRNQLNTCGCSSENTWEDKKEKINRQIQNYREVILQFVTIGRICRFNMWLSTLNKNTTSAADLRLMNRRPVLPLSSSATLQSVSGICGRWRSLKKSWLVPSNNGSLGAWPWN